jgi:hypothetical protein
MYKQISCLVKAAKTLKGTSECGNATVRINFGSGENLIAEALVTMNECDFLMLQIFFNPEGLQCMRRSWIEK